MDRTIAVTRTCKLPLDTIADQLSTDPAAVLQPATDAAAGVANDIVLSLDSKWAWFDVHEETRARIGELTKSSSEAKLPLSWDAASHKRLLPAVEGNLGLYPLSATYTEISYTGKYTPPPGLLAGMSERLVGRRVLQAAIGHLLDEVVAKLEELHPTPASV